MPYAFVTAFTPGPNNILALNSVSNYGWKRSRFMLAGICSGFLCVMVVCALGCFELAQYLPAFVDLMKYVGAAYILWLALHVARSKPSGAGETEKTSFWKGFMLQFVNVKIILYGLTVYTGYVLAVSQSPAYLLLSVILSTVVGCAGTLTWAAVGGILNRFIGKHYKGFNLSMALLLVWCAVMLLVE
ncbi:LysE family transporter [Anaerovorax odorimutans]|uniref:LysE family transporter n=1 Tax=Anaerovorax odorimutans TaxID=109327 RepID=A0ABT1RQV3_9FIRM|nr:LysE family transporter [Anaerovorax odorimutans]